MVVRQRWTCPRCGRKWDIPAGPQPVRCPKCAPQNSGPKAIGPQIPADGKAAFAPLPPELGAGSEADRSYSAKRRRSRAFAIIAALAAVVCFLVLGLFLAFEQAGNPRKGDLKSVAAAVAAVLPHGDPDLTAVRAWLKENLNVADWEEVRWWPAQDMVQWKQDEVILARFRRDEAKSQVDGKNAAGQFWAKELKEREDDLRSKENEPPTRLCRLKYRAKNAVGATEIYDEFFEIRGGKAELWVPYGYVDKSNQAFFRSKARKFFPD
jgi:hypothetical protein